MKVALPLTFVLVLTLALAPGATAEESSSSALSAQEGTLAGGQAHTCLLSADGTVRCWGAGASGRLGYGNTNSIGDDELPVAAGSRSR